MGKNKNVRVIQPYEMKCCSVQIKLKEEVLKEFDKCNPDDPSSFDSVSAEARSHMNTPAEVGKEFGYVGVTMQVPFMYVLFKFEEQDKAVEYFKKICELGYEAKLVKNVCYADKRYLEGDFAQKCVTLPPDYLDSAIQDLFKKYCGGEVEITDDIKLDALEYTGDLGGRTIHAFIGGGDKMLVLEMNNGTALQTNNPCGTYKRLLADFEKEIIEWRNSHSGCAKPITEVAQA